MPSFAPLRADRQGHTSSLPSRGAVPHSTISVGSSLSRTPAAALRRRRAKWCAAFDERLGRDDFVGTQLLLDRADALGVVIDAAERERRQESRTSAIEARKHSLLFEIRQTRRGVAQGAALGFLRE